MGIYISGALTAAMDIDNSRRFYQHLAQICERAGFEPYVPHLKTDPELHAEVSPQEVFETDVSEVLRSTAVVAYVGEPSLGVGAELAVAYGEKIPIISVALPGERVSRLIRGLVQASGGFEIVCSEADLSEKLTAALAQLDKSNVLTKATTAG